MQKLDRLGWAAGISFSAFGLSVGIRTNRPDLPASLIANLPPGWKRVSCRKPVEHLFSLFLPENPAHPKLRRFALAYLGAGVVARSLDQEVVTEGLISFVHRLVAEYSRREIFLHAGVVGWKGAAILIPGRSMAGKSTLVTELVKAGATYYSDEYALLTARGHVLPYPRPISLRDEAMSTRKISIAELGAKAGSSPLPVGTVIFTSYKKAAGWRPRKLAPGQAVLHLLANVVQARTRPEVALPRLEKIVSSAEVLKGARGEAESLAPIILSRT